MARLARLWGGNSFQNNSYSGTALGLPFEMLDSDWLHPDPALPFIRELQAHQSSVVL